MKITCTLTSKRAVTAMSEDKINYWLCAILTSFLGGRQLFSLGEGCITSNVIKHETLHALGSQHEQQRPDRDQYIKILYENVEESGMRK
jgi:hypothetical protein